MDAGRLEEGVFALDDLLLWVLDSETESSGLVPDVLFAAGVCGLLDAIGLRIGKGHLVVFQTHQFEPFFEDAQLQ